MVIFTNKDLIEFLESLKQIVIRKDELDKLNSVIEILRLNEDKESRKKVLSFLKVFSKEIVKHVALEYLIRAFEESLK